MNRSGDPCSNSGKCRSFSRFSMPAPLPKTIDDTQALLAAGEYVADRSLATSLFLALAMRRPLFLEGEAGDGDTQIGKVEAAALTPHATRLPWYHGRGIPQAA